MRTLRIYHVELREPRPDEHKHTYFGSMKAIFDVYDKNRLGVSYLGLKNNYNLKTTEYENKRCVIRSGVVTTSKQVNKYDRSRKTEESDGDRD